MSPLPPLTFVLLFLQCLVTTVHATEAVGSCCLGTTNTTVSPRRIVRYTRQSEAVCPIPAIIFYTKKGIRICSDPEGSWAVTTMDTVDKRRGNAGTGGPALTQKTGPGRQGGPRQRRIKGNGKGGNGKGGKGKGGKGKGGKGKRGVRRGAVTAQQ